MAWSRIDDAFADHPKMVAAGPLAMALQIRALCWCNRYLTDGWIPETVLDVLLWDYGAYEEVAPSPREWPDFMVKHGLWEKGEGGYRIHDYLDYNRSKQQVMDERAKKATAGKQGGLAAHRLKRPLPSTNGRPSPTPNDPMLIIWPLYPNKRDKKHAERALHKALAKPGVTVERLVNAIRQQQQSDQWKQENGRYIPLLTTWLNKERWNDELIGPPKLTVAQWHERYAGTPQPGECLDNEESL